MVLKGTWKRPERKQWHEFKEIKQSQPWYQVYDIGDNVYAIYEPYQVQEVISYLICGGDKALLWDTGFFGGDMKKLVEELWDKEVIVVNSHTHFDHICGNYQFTKVYVHNSDYAFKELDDGIPQELILEEYCTMNIAEDAPIELDVTNLVFHPCSYEGVDEGHIFDLGNRKLKVIYTPGHSDDSMMLVDEQNQLLFTGDTYYPGVIYGQYVESLIPYYETLYELARHYDLYTLIPSHNEPRRDGSKLFKLAEALKLVSENKVDFKEVGDGSYKMYQVDEFQILTSKGERR